MRHVGTAWVGTAFVGGLAVLVIACGGDAPAIDGGAVDAAQVDGGLLDSSAPRDAAPDAPDADWYCHWDCFGGHFCVDGVVHTRAHTPIPCEHWTGSCPESVSYACERGCRTDGVTETSRIEDPVSMCEEGRPKIEGDPCEDDTHCLPPSSRGPWESVDRLHLTCDEATSLCVAAPDPTPSDWLAPCAADLSYLLDPTDSGYVYGFVEDPACTRGVCLVTERDTCVVNACSQPCEHDWDCPDGAECELGRMDRTRRDGGSPTILGVCEPRVPPELDCR